MLAEMRKLHGFTDVNSDQLNAGLQAWLTYDRATAARLGISAQLIDDTLYDAFGQRQVSTMFTSLNQYHVVMEVDPQFWQNPKGLDMIYIRPTHGATVPSPGSLATSSLASSQPTPAPTPFEFSGGILPRRRVVPRPRRNFISSACSRAYWRLLHLQLPVRNLRMDRSQSLRRRFRLPSLRLARRRHRGCIDSPTATPSTTLGSSSPAASSVAVATPGEHTCYPSTDSHTDAVCYTGDSPLPVRLLHRTLLLHRPTRVLVLHRVLRQRRLCR